MLTALCPEMWREGRLGVSAASLALGIPAVLSYSLALSLGLA